MVTEIKKMEHTGLNGRTVIGIDVGGDRKGFHAVALTGGKYTVPFTTKCIDELVAWCHKVKGSVIAVDAPCRWSKDEGARPAERELMNKGIWCFSTPTRHTADTHLKNHYGWMLRGMKLFEALEPSHPLCCAFPSSSEKYCFETFPHAVTWHLRGGDADASNKRSQRREILEKNGVDIAKLTNIDLVDAAICALVAHRVVTGESYLTYGDVSAGFIVVPK